jgi:N-acetylglucosaminyldiphosphoundecaprenol N-acetyl-beta-D-mannosaminyltransferase
MRNLSTAQGRRIFGIELTCLSRRHIVQLISETEIQAKTGVRLVVTANIDHIAYLRRNVRFRNAYAQAWLATADGTPVFLYARLHGVAVPERVTGIDLFPDLLYALTPGTHRLFFVVGKHRTAEKLMERLKTRGFSLDQIGVDVTPLGFEDDPSYGERLAQEIRRRATTHLFFGVGAPRSEIWVHEHRKQLGSLYAFGFGSALDYYAGTARRIPRSLRTLGLGWLWRVVNEPKRLLRRYLVNFCIFAGAVVDDLRSGGRCPLLIEEERPPESS